MPLIRTTFDPTVEIFVSDEEYLDLDRQGLIYTGAPTPPTPVALKLQLEVVAGIPDEFTAQVVQEEVV